MIYFLILIFSIVNIEAAYSGDLNDTNKHVVGDKKKGEKRKREQRDSESENTDSSPSSEEEQNKSEFRVEDKEKKTESKQQQEEKENTEATKITYYNSGQGNCVLVSKDEEALLVDCGGNGRSDADKNKIVEHIASKLKYSVNAIQSQLMMIQSHLML